MKINEGYENHGLSRFMKWINGDPIENDTNETRIPVIEGKEHVSLYHRLRVFISHHLLQWYERSYTVFAVIIAISIITVLLCTVANLPSFGNPDNPVNNEVSERYIESGLQETGAVNIVAGMILDYRAFDTLGESHVLFIAATSVLILLRMDYKKDGHLDEASGSKDEGYDRQFEPRHDVILQMATRVLFPVTALFGIYVILNGHLSAGGGFAGGAIIGAALVLYNNAFGFKRERQFFTYNTFKYVSLCALLSYALLKTYAFYTGANHLESGIPLGNPGAILSSGLILPLNICVGCVVACTMYTFYVMFRKGGM